MKRTSLAIALLLLTVASCKDDSPPSLPDDASLADQGAEPSPDQGTDVGFWPAGRPCLHAHNDYLHPRPLLDALDHGACSVEADVFWVDGELRVAHYLEDTSPGRTLGSLYLDPLRQVIADNDGSVYGDGMQLTLLVDFKTDAATTWPAVAEALEAYAPLLTRFEGSARADGPVLVVISGERPVEQILAAKVRLAALDGRLDELDRPDLVAVSPLCSDNWLANFPWAPGFGEMPADLERKLEQTIDRVHQNGQRLRFWKTADTPEMWRLLADAGVDLLGIDDLAAGRAFLDGYR